ncbi:MAG: hypothetical protein ACE5JP_16365 [Candidatus Bipolaricaulia bacterium]
MAITREWPDDATEAHVGISDEAEAILKTGALIATVLHLDGKHRATAGEYTKGVYPNEKEVRWQYREFLKLLKE